MMSRDEILESLAKEISHNECLESLRDTVKATLVACGYHPKNGKWAWYHTVE